jgi:flagellar FliJ protein
MKKFIFTLQSLFSYKQTIEKQQKTELKNAQQLLRELVEQERRLLEAYAENERSLEKALRGNIDVAAALNEHDAYFRFLRDALKELRERIVKAEQIVSDCQNRLIRTMREIKTYNKLRDEQYQEYLKETRSEEEKEIGDLVSFTAISE